MAIAVAIAVTVVRSDANMRAINRCLAKAGAKTLQCNDQYSCGSPPDLQAKCCHFRFHIHHLTS